LAAGNAHSLKHRDFNFDELELARERSPLAVHKSVEHLSWLMDDLFRVPVLGWRFGLDAIIGLVPGLGDTATSLVSFYILVTAVRYRVPKITLLRMGLNIALDYGVGSLPIVGDLADAWWKANRKNVDLLRRSAAISLDEAPAARTSDWIFVGGIIAGLALLLIGSLLVSFYLWSKLFTGFTG
jgi:Domain of unknown function (DUF4112)